jgi:hypothetical protein
MSEKKAYNPLLLRLGILSEMVKTLWKYKLWWSFPILFLLFFVLIFLWFAGHTGIAAFIYPLF